MIRKFQKLPVVVEAVQWLGKNWDELDNFVIELCCAEDITDNGDQTLTIHTLEGDMLCEKKDWIIRGVSGEVYPCKPDIFKKTYVEVTEK